MKASMYQLANKIFYQKSILSYLLLPFSWIYLFVISIIQLLYKTKIRTVKHFPIPVIVVGNLTVGGTGKTPLTIYLANLLKRHGFRPAIVSRGYGGKAPHYPYPVGSNTSPSLVGDEAVLIARHTDCPVIVSPSRVEAVQYILQQNNCDIILADDGLQHHALGRDIEIVVIDGQRRFGNGFCLPAGPLREPISRLTKVDFRVCNGNNALSDEFAMTFTVDVLHGVKDAARTKSLVNFKNQTIHAVAGIGNPERFFNFLRDQGLKIIPHDFPDHHNFQT